MTRRRIIAPVLWPIVPVLLVVLVALILQPVSSQDMGASSVAYRWFCDLSNEPVVTLQWDANRQSYVPVTTGGISSNNNNNSSSSSSSSSPYFKPDNQRRELPSSSVDYGWIEWLWDKLTIMEDIDDDDDDDNNNNGHDSNSYEMDEYSRNNELSQHQQQQPNYLRSSSSLLRLPTVIYHEPALWSSSDDSHRAETVLHHRSLQQGQPPESLTTILVEENGSGTTTGNPTGGNLEDIVSPIMPVTIEARSCDCWNSVIWGGTYYCTMPRTPCAIPSSPTSPPGCVDLQNQRQVVRSIWPVLIVWYASVLFCLSFTMTGRYAMSCCLSAVIPGFNRRLADRVLTNDPNQANQMLLRHYRVMRMRHEQRLLRRLRQRARQSRRTPNDSENDSNNVNNNNNNNQGHTADPDFEPFPSLWDFAIFPRRDVTMSNNEPVATTLTLKTKIYRHGGILEDDKDNEVVEDAGYVENGDKKPSATPNLPAPTSRELDQGTVQKADPDDGRENSEAKEVEMTETVNKTSQAIRTESTPMTVATTNEITVESQRTAGVDASEWDDNTCAICYVPIEDGDRVGALPCGHIFHVDPCLKHWLSRRNVCPLCLQENIATPQFEHPTLNTTTTGGMVQDTNSANSQDQSSSQDDDDSSGVRMDGTIPYTGPALGEALRGRGNTNETGGLASGLTSFFRRRN